MLGFGSLFLYEIPHEWSLTRAPYLVLVLSMLHVLFPIVIVCVLADSDGRIRKIIRSLCMQDTKRCDACNKDPSLLSLLFYV
jgi:hypothetical protein